jgi:hypothetical protein
MNGRPVRNLTPITSRVYPERKVIKERIHHAKKLKPNRVKQINISSEYHQEKTGYARIRRKRKCRATQDPQDRPRIFQYQIILNERAIQTRRENSRESKVIPRKDQTSLAMKVMVTLKARKCREKRHRRPRSPARSWYHASNCFVFQGKSADFYTGLDLSADFYTRAFDCPRFRVQAALAYGLDESGQRGKHIALDRDRGQQILDGIQ